MTAARRRWLYGAVGAAAALAGAGSAWWLHGQPGRGEGEAAAPAGERGLWEQRFETPAGGTLDMAKFKGRRLAVNFWATWCPPCVEEMPMLDAFFRENASKGWQLIGLAIDQPSAVRRFLERTPVAYPIGLAGLGGTDLGRALGNAAGGLPFTVVFGSDGQVAQRKLGQLKPVDLQAWLAVK